MTRGLRRLIAAVVSPHGHDHAHAVDRAVAPSAEGLRALKVSVLGLGVTAGLQVVVVVVSGSVALLADTIHNFSDALTAVPLAAAFLLARRPPTSRYTYGYGRAEDLAGVVIVVMIAVSAAVAGWESLRRFADPQPLRHVGWVIAAGVIGFAGNELVAAYRIRSGRRIGSAALVADGLHARTDGFTSLAVVVGALGVAAGVPVADPIVGAVVTVVILFVLKDAARDIYRRLMDSVDPELVGRVEQVLEAVPGIEAVESTRVRWIGHQLRAEVEVVSDCRLTLTAAHDIAHEGHHRLLHEIPRLADAIVHTSPCGHGGRDHHEPLAHHRVNARQRA